MSENGYRFIEVFDELAQASDSVKNVRIKNASVRKEDNVLYLTILENVDGTVCDEIKTLLVTAYGFGDVVIITENKAETAAAVEEAPAQTDEAPVDEAGADTAEQAPDETAPSIQPSDSDEYAFAEVLNMAISKSPPVASLLAGCKYAISGDSAIITLAKGGKAYLDSRGVTAFLEKQLRTATEKPYTIVYDGVTEVEKELTDAEIIELSTDPNSVVNKEVERVLLGSNITKAPVPMSSINEDTGRVCVEGDIFKIDARETRDGSKIRATIYVTDYTASIAVKLEDLTVRLQHVIDKLAEGKRIRARGLMRYDRFFCDNCLFADDLMLIPKQTVPDTSEEKRVELHLHTNMSSMDAVTDISDYVKRACEWGHKAIAVTDHGVVQAFPAAAAAAKKQNIKIIYGVEDYFINDNVKVFVGDADVPLSGDFIVFDIETTGTAFADDRITEIAALRFRNGDIIDEFTTFCNPEKKISEKIEKITGITNEMVADAPKEADAVGRFVDFCGGCVLVAHNAAFDTGFIAAACKRNGIPFEFSYIDTVPLCRKYYPKLKNARLDTVAKNLGYGDFRHHRAMDDTKVLAAIFRDLTERLSADGIESTLSLNDALEGMNTNSMHRFHQVLLVKNKTGLKNLYKLVSKAHIDNFYRQPRIKKSDLDKLREGLLVGSACVEGELYRAFLEMRSEEEILEIAEYYDYFEIQPVANNEFLINDDDITAVKSKDDIRAINKKIVELGERLGKLVVATGDVHFLNPRDSIFREVLMDAVGYQPGETESELYFRSTDNMLREFSYLGEEKAFEVVVTNTNKIADMIDVIIPVPDKTFNPAIPGAEKNFRENTYAKAHEIYGDPLPEIVEERLAKEVNSVIKNKFSVMYESARRIVKFSNDNGYIVGSRGSVGSSFAATMAGITEINPLPPHYVCKKCKHSEFITDESVKSGFELEEKACPVCGEIMISDGQDIPFETFLGFNGEKAPDIDLNISGEFQSTVHKYVDSLFGAEYCFKAGTISVIQDRTAYGFVRKYLESRGKTVSNAETERLITGITGVKRTTGQHPGGIVVVPKSYEIYDFTPVQHPADKSESDIVTTHFDFNSMHDTLLKLDLLGHDVPTLAKHLTDMTDTPFTSVPLNDKKVMSLFTSPEALGVEAKQINCETGTLGLPEMGTEFVRQMLVDAQPKKFSDLLQISGLSHGTDVWLGNAQDLIKNKTCTISEVIGTRDGIMLELIRYGLDKAMAFKIMEFIRKNKKGLPIPDEMIKAMEEKKVPKWYIDSCRKIKYMFPKAHAAAYVISAIRLGWYKVYRPREFYAALFTVRPDGFDAETMSGGVGSIKSKRAVLIAKLQESSAKMSANDKNALNVLDLSIEMYERGIRFLPVHIYKSDPFRFLVEEDGIRMPFIAVAGLGGSVAMALADARKESKFSTQEDIKNVPGVSKTIVETMDRLGAFADIPKSNQLTFF